MDLNIRGVWPLVGFVLLFARTVAAQEDVASDASPDAVAEGGNESTWTYPKSYSIRPLTMQRGMVRANGIFTFWDDGVDLISGITLGGSISVTDDIELGLNNYRIGSSLQQNYEGLVAVVFSPSAGYGDIPIYGRYRFLHLDKLDFAGDIILVMPIDTPFALEVALPFRVIPNDQTLRRHRDRGTRHVWLGRLCGHSNSGDRQLQLLRPRVHRWGDRGAVHPSR